jgi:branched-chain amino acid transport system substrate-binding protein
MTRRIAVFAAVLALVLTQAPPPAPAADDASPYELNAVLSLTGPAAFLGSHYARTLDIAAKTVNREGGINGHPLKIVIADDGSSAQTSVQLVNALIAKKVAAIIGPGFTATCSAALPLVDKTGPVSYCLSPVIKPDAGSFMFSAGPSAREGIFYVLRALRANKWMKMALVTTTDASGQDVERELDDVLKTPQGKGFEIVDREHFNNSDVSMAAQVSRMKAASPQVIFSFAVGTGFATLLRGLNDAGVDLPVFASGGNLNYGQLDSYATFIPKQLYLFAARGAAPDPTAHGVAKTAEDRFFNAFKDAGLRVEALDSVAWDPVMLVVDALRNIGPAASADQIRDFIASSRNWSGLVGQYDFQLNPQRGISPNGVRVYLWNAQDKSYATIRVPGER